MARPDPPGVGSLVASAAAVAGAEGDGHVDWTAVARVAKSLTDRGDLELDAAAREGYADDVRDARDAVREAAGLDFELPSTVEIQHRHHWIDANVAAFERVMRPLEGRAPDLFPGVARAANTAVMGGTLGFLARHVLGQYDPLLLAEGDPEHGLYFVHPNIREAASTLEVESDLFRRWIAFHEVTHAAEFALAPWLSTYLEDQVERSVDALADGSLDRDAFREVDLAMTAVEGYAELLMDRAFDADATELRAKLDARRRGGDPLTRLIRRLLGLGLKRRQYERGRRFFETVADARGLEGAAVVWDDPANLPDRAELEDPGLWLERVPNA